MTNEGSYISRRCINCKFCAGEIIAHCENNDAKKYFGYEKEEFMSSKFGKRRHRGYFCKFFKLLKKFRK